MSSFASRTRAFSSIVLVAFLALTGASVACNQSTDDCNATIKIILQNSVDSSAVTVAGAVFVNGTTTLSATCESGDGGACDGTWDVSVNLSAPNVQVTVPGYQAKSFEFMTGASSCDTPISNYVLTVPLTPAGGS